MKVMKRDGTFVEFNIQKITDVIHKAFHSIPLSEDDSIIDFLALKVTADMQEKIIDNTIHVEQIQDSVEKVLSQSGYSQVAKAYILYRRQRENIRALKTTTEQYKSIVDSYLNDPKYRVTENSMANYSIGGLMFSNSGSITTNYWLHDIYDAEIAKAHTEGDIHIHDLDMLTGDSAGWSIQQIIDEGLGGVKGYIQSRPAKHLSTLCNQIVNFLSIVQNEWAGAQTLSGFDTYLAPFVKVDSLSYKQVYKEMENFVYGINMPNRWGNQVSFSNIILDWNIPEQLMDTKVKIQNVEQDFCFGDCQKECEMIDQALLEIFYECQSNERGFQFPIPTIRMRKFNFEEERCKLLFQLSAKYGLPHFDTQIEEPYSFNEDALYKKSSGYFGYGNNLGSIGTVTINLPRISKQTKTKKEFFERLDYILDVSIRSLHVKRQVLSKFLESGLYPYTKRYIKNLDHHFSTIGIIGMEETSLYLEEVQTSLMNSQTFAHEIFDAIEKRLLQAQKIYHEPFNLEATPGEGVTYRFAKIDGETKLYYTNASNLAVNATSDIFEALDLQESLLNRYSGGSLFNIYLDQPLSDWKSAKNLVKTICSNYSIPTFTITPTYSYCKEHGYLPGKKEICPNCQNECEVFSRVTGYYRPVHEWNDGKLEEYKHRIYFEVE